MFIFAKKGLPKVTSPPASSPTALAPKTSPFKVVGFQAFSRHAFSNPTRRFECTQIQPALDLVPGLSLYSLNMLIQKQWFCVQKRWEGRGKMAVPTPHQFWESHIQSHSFLKLKPPTLAIRGEVILMMPNMSATNAGGRRETALLWSCSCCRFSTPLLHPSPPPYPFLSLLKFCV